MRICTSRSTISNGHSFPHILAYLACEISISAYLKGEGLSDQASPYGETSKLCHSSMPLSPHGLWVCPYPSSSMRSHNTLCDGMKGDPSYKTVATPDARPVTSQFHIIQPVCKQNKQVAKYKRASVGPAVVVLTHCGVEQHDITGSEVSMEHMLFDYLDQSTLQCTHIASYMLQHCITTLQHCITTLQHCITTLHNTSLQHCITTLQHFITTLQHFITTVQHCITTLQHCITTLHHDITALHYNITTLHYNITTLHYNTASRHYSTALQHYSTTLQHCITALHSNALPLPFLSHTRT